MAEMSLVDYTNLALDLGYAKTAGPMLRNIKALGKSPQVQFALDELDTEAAQIDRDGGQMTADNAHLQKAMTAVATEFEMSQAAIIANDKRIQESGQAVAPIAVTAKLFQQVAGAMRGNPILPSNLPRYVKALAKMGVAWNLPRALDFATGYVDSPAWVARMNGWGSGYAELVRQTVLDGIRNGWGPKYTASQMRQYAENLPRSAAENLTRTLQLTSYRDASVAMESINGSFIQGKVRIARLDERTCLSCIALHGTVLRPGERIDDHYRGRCTEFYQIYGGPQFPSTMQSDGTPGNRNFVPWKSGPDWFGSLPPDRQQAQASFAKSPAKWNAFMDGVPLSEFVGQHMDSVFGQQVIEQSLARALGDNASQYYARNQEQND